MTVTYVLSQVFALAASILYLLIFLFILHNAVIRLTPYKSRLSKAVSNTAFLLFTAVLYTWLGSIGFGATTFVLPSHVFVLALTWAEYYRGSKEDRSNG